MKKLKIQVHPDKFVNKAPYLQYDANEASKLINPIVQSICAGNRSMDDRLEICFLYVNVNVSGNVVSTHLDFKRYLQDITSYFYLYKY